MIKRQALTSNLKLWGMSLIFLSFMAYPLQAQDQNSVPTTPEIEVDGTNIDDLPGDSQQMKTWRCLQGDKAIAVLAKDSDVWRGIIEPQGWQCDEDIPMVMENDHLFSCEPTANIGLITVIWLQGKGGKSQMQSWMNDLMQQGNLICTLRTTTEDWD